MVKRLISANTSEILAMSAAELKQSIKACEGRVILSENVGFKESYIGDISNSEMARAFGADLILLNGVDLLNPVILLLILMHPILSQSSIDWWAARLASIWSLSILTLRWMKNGKN